MSDRTATQPEVSVLLAVRNGAETLVECLDSIAAQSLARHECIIVDDGSTDATASMLADRARTDPRVRNITLEPRGVVSALKKLMSSSR